MRSAFKGSMPDPRSQRVICERFTPSRSASATPLLNSRFRARILVAVATAIGQEYRNGFCCAIYTGATRRSSGSQERARVEVRPLAERLGEVSQHEQHGAIEAVVHDDRDPVPLGGLEELVLDAQDLVEVGEILVCGALALAHLARGEARWPRVAVERRDDEEDHVGALAVVR